MSFDKEFSDSIKVALLDRVSSPLVGTYVFSWLAWNVQPVLLVIFGSGPMQLRINAAAMLLNTWTGIWGPLLTGTIWALFYPSISLFYFKYWQKTKDSKQRYKIGSEEKNAIPPEVWNKLRDELVEKKKEIIEIESRNSDTLLKSEDKIRARFEIDLDATKLVHNAEVTRLEGVNVTLDRELSTIKESHNSEASLIQEISEKNEALNKEMAFFTTKNNQLQESYNKSQKELEGLSSKLILVNSNSEKLHANFVKYKLDSNIILEEITKKSEDSSGRRENQLGTARRRILDLTSELAKEASERDQENKDNHERKEQLMGQITEINI